MSKDEKCCLNCKIFWDKEYGCEDCRFEHKDHPSLFYRITRSPEVLAKELITTSYDEFKNCTVYWAWLGDGRREAYCTREEAIAATVAKLKEVSDE